MPPSPQDVLTVSNCYGAMLIGSYLSLMLFGLSLYQVYEYATASHKDPLRKKLYVLIIISLSTFQSVLCSHVSYHELVTIQSMSNITSAVIWQTFWSFDLQALTSDAITIACQSYYIYRLYQLSKRCRLVAITAICLLLTELGLSIAVTVYCFRSKLYSDSHIVSEWFLRNSMYRPA
ncbi:hypothetical protein C8Q80DRAFT_667611 [Daedaleopsis nitida]|nr:hypothetical protein C8Q80DRAFT_667611 [Daedaleopsis nitida]